VPEPALQTPNVQAVVKEEQLIGVPAHVPEVQMSFWVQRFPSLQGPPSPAGTASQAPDDGLQVPTRQPLFRPEQSTGVPPHAPPEQTSFCVQRSPSSQAPPSLTGVASQRPFAGLQTPMRQAVFKPEQSTGAPTQAPEAQTSFWVQASPSSHGPLSLPG
jgi:hypothetical protein